MPCMDAQMMRSLICWTDTPCASVSRKVAGAEATNRVQDHVDLATVSLVLGLCGISPPQWQSSTQVRRCQSDAGHHSRRLQNVSILLTDRWERTGSQHDV
jgi:hypothetical protein